MNILGITSNYYPELNAGVEIYVDGLSRKLSKRHKVMIFTRSKVVNKPCIEYNGHFHVFKIPRKNTKRDVKQYLKQCLIMFKPDIVHIHHLAGLGLQIPSLLLNLHIPYVITLHDYWFLCGRIRLVNDSGDMCDGPGLKCVLCVAGKKLHKLPNALIEFLLRKTLYVRTLKSASVVLVSSNKMKERLVRVGLNQKNINLIKIGINKDAIKRVLTKEKNYRVFGFIGTISRFKGVHVLIKAFEGIESNSRLFLYGKPTGKERKFFQTLIEKNERISFNGVFDHSEINSVLSEIDILVVPSICGEAHCLVIDEARAAGIPVIVSKIGAIPERIINEKNGFLIEPNNVDSLREKMQWLLDNYNSVKDILDYNFNLHTIEENTDILIEIYRDTIKSNSFKS